MLSLLKYSPSNNLIWKCSKSVLPSKSRDIVTLDRSFSSLRIQSSSPFNRNQILHSQLTKSSGSISSRRYYSSDVDNGSVSSFESKRLLGQEGRQIVRKIRQRQKEEV